MIKIFKAGVTLENWKRNLFICWLGSFATTSALSQIAPVLPLFIKNLGMHDMAQIETWSGIAFGSTTFVMAFFSPFWGKLADKYGRKPMLLRASLGMAIVVGSISLVNSVYQLVGLRILMGTISGFNSGAITLIATQTPENKAGWALGTLSTGTISGMLLGPLMGGYLVELLGIRSIFIVMGLFLLIAFFLTLFFVQEDFTPPQKALMSFGNIWHILPDKTLIIGMFITTFIIQAALFSIEPIITVYISSLAPQTEHLAFISGLVFASSGFSSILAAPLLGRLSDRIGAHKIILASLICATILFIPQAFVKNEWQLMGLRFLIGIPTGAMLPSINTILKQNIPPEIAGRMFSYNQTAQFLGVFCGSVLGGQIAAHSGIRNLFFFTSFLLFVNLIGVREFIYKRADDKFTHTISHSM
ncbi:multidrug efflux MFS transporter [Pectinatus sottacetonis]|uniref:multidrug efflux MFS transporter n=1 Tax=Pectinatus sottacetonis TaxID=1002795 RepID=UPI001E404366|nr:multidrug efflux MFS transporter [Pectinatus sottacetonis]